MATPETLGLRRGSSSGLLNYKHPSVQSSFEWEPITLRVEFGDGYSERVTDGPQEFRDRWTLTYRNLDRAQAEELGRFIRRHSSRTAFYWEPPWDAEDLPALTGASFTKTRRKKLWTIVPGTVRHEPHYGEDGSGGTVNAGPGIVESISVSGGVGGGLISITFQIVQEFDLV